MVCRTRAFDITSVSADPFLCPLANLHLVYDVPRALSIVDCSVRTGEEGAAWTYRLTATDGEEPYGPGYVMLDVDKRQEGDSTTPVKKSRCHLVAMMFALACK